MILILVREAVDAHAQYVKEKLEKKGFESIFLNFSFFPNKNKISFFKDERGHRVVFYLDNKRVVDSSEITSVYNRRRAEPLARPEIVNEKVRSYIQRESQFLLDALPKVMGVPWVSDPDTINIAAKKPYQLMVASSVGFEVPPTIITNSLEDLQQFPFPEEDQIAIKSIAVPFIETGHPETDSLILYTAKTKLSELLTKSEAIESCPTIYQPYIEKEFELRITVVGAHVFACAIYSQKSERTKDDWRRYDIANTPHTSFQLPINIENACRKLVRELNLQFGCIDMIVTPRGKYIFLEVNPNGQWLWIERLTGLPIGETLADLLTQRSCNQ